MLLIRPTFQGVKYANNLLCKQEKGTDMSKKPRLLNKILLMCLDLQEEALATLVIVEKYTQKLACIHIHTTV